MSFMSNERLIFDPTDIAVSPCPRGHAKFVAPVAKRTGETATGVQHVRGGLVTAIGQTDADDR